MQRILLLDDSPIIHKVVKLTYSDPQKYAVSIARTPKEAEDQIAATSPTVIVGYHQFSGSNDPSYFVSLKERCPAIVILAESNVSTEGFERAGFKSILRKPFHSDQLKAAVNNLLGTSEAEFGNNEDPSQLKTATLALSDLPNAKISTPPPPPAPKFVEDKSEISAIQVPPVMNHAEIPITVRKGKQESTFEVEANSLHPRSFENSDISKEGSLIFDTNARLPELTLNMKNLAQPFGSQAKNVAQEPMAKNQSSTESGDFEIELSSMGGESFQINDMKNHTPRNNVAQFPKPVSTIAIPETEFNIEERSQVFEVDKPVSDDKVSEDVSEKIVEELKKEMKTLLENWLKESAPQICRDTIKLEIEKLVSQT